VALVQFGGDRKGTLERYRIVALLLLLCDDHHNNHDYDYGGE